MSEPFLPAQRTPTPAQSVRRASLVIALSSLLMIGPSRMALGGPFDVFGFGPRAIGMAGAVTAIADDYTAGFYNPANLVLRKHIHLGAEYLLAVPSMSIDLQRPQDKYQSVDPGIYQGFSIGVLFPLGGKIDYRFAIGVALHLPTEQLLQIEALDPLIPRWFLVDSLTNKFQFLLAVGFEITDWLSVGAGFQGLASIVGSTAIDVDWINEEFPYRTVRADLQLTMSPVLGLHVGPFWGLSAGLSWRHEMALDFDMPIEFDFGETLDVTLVTSGRALYTPHVLSFGVAWAISDRPWLVAIDLRRWFWSRSADPALTFALDMSGEILEGLSAEEAFDFLPGPSGLPGFSDTWSIHAGAEVPVNKHLLARFGYQFRPSPLPEQVGLSNYVDNDAHTLSAGLGVRIPDPLEIDEYPLTIELSASYSLLPEQQIHKLSDSDPVGDYAHGGQLFTTSLTLRHDY